MQNEGPSLQKDFQASNKEFYNTHFLPVPVRQSVMISSKFYLDK